MKRLFILSAIALVIFLVSFTFRNNASSISGRVTPADAASTVLAISGKDTVTGILTTGNFSMTVKPGVYRVWIDTRDPYKDVLLENISVKEGQAIDVGEIVVSRLMW